MRIHEIHEKGGSVMDASKEGTYDFLDGFIGEMTQLFPDPYFHIGGDEVIARIWNQPESIQAFAKEHELKDAAAIQVYFNRRVPTELNRAVESLASPCGGGLEADRTGPAV